MQTAEIRSRFLKFFETNGHTKIESSSLVPSNDPTLLFTTAGMVQFKDVFLGKDIRPYKRATTAQKCVRAGGKHNDLENVGFTARHHTFFEMLGNFSFGDYFKKDAIHFAWEFVTKELQMPKDKLYVSVFTTDDEAADIWHKQENVPRDRILRFGEKDNFWSMGDTGPCGPCTELFVDRGEKYGTLDDGDRLMEFWNLVFMQYDRDASGKLNPLPKPSVDTGAGLERIAAILQNCDSNYDTDAFQHIIQETARIANTPYNRAHDSAVSFRVVADHSRAATFLIGDGVMPSNEGRGYVLRRIMRRAIRHGKKLGFTGPFLFKTCGFVIDQMKDAYPDLIEKRAFIERAVLAEEEQFFKTLERGLSLLDDEFGKLAGAKTLSGAVAFKLYDTYGFPLDLTRTICEEKKLTIDEPGFQKEMAHQKAESRKNWKGSGQESLDEIYLKLTRDLAAKNKLPQFVGYETLTSKGECVALLLAGNEGIKSVDSFSAPTLAASSDSAENVTLEAVFSITPFYGESGGQAGDLGRVTSLDGFEGEVVDVQKPTPELICVHLKPVKGTIKIGQVYEQVTESEHRALIARNHTATHLLHWALREVLGKHVKQAGSLVNAELLRFDFAHFQAMTPAELQKVEDMINEKIWSGSGVKKQEMGKDEAISAGAIAFFGEKYGDKVRVVSVGDFSTELCGGTHVDRSSDIGLFKIVSEQGIAAGVRRMIAYTSKTGFQYLRENEHGIKTLRERLKAVSVDDIFTKLDRAADHERALRKQIEQLQAKSAAGEVDEMLTQAVPLKGARLVFGICEPSQDAMKRLRDLADRVKQKAPDSLVILGMQDPTEPKASLVVAVGPAAPKTLNANEFLKELAPIIGGKGGGKPDFAQAGGTHPSGLSAIKAKAEEIAKKILA